MSNKWTRIGVAIALVAAGFGLSRLYGWLSAQRPDPPQVTPPAVTLRPPDRIELMPPTSDETMRRHVYAENAREIRTDIFYKNGDMARTILRPDGSMEEFRREDKDGKILVLRKFDLDGKTVVSGEERRPDGSLKSQIYQSYDKMINTKVFWWDGSLFSHTKQYPRGGSYETTFYRRSGSISGKRLGPSPGVVAREEYWTKSGNQEWQREKVGNKLIYTIYSGGLASYRQTFIEEKNSYGGTSKKLTLLEEFDTDGKTLTRKIMYEVSQWYASTIEVYKDGQTIVRKMNSSGYVDSDEIRDDSGNVIETKTYTYSDYQREDVEYRKTYEPSTRDPVSGWENQEKYDYYRNQDE